MEQHTNLTLSRTAASQNSGFEFVDISCVSNTSAQSFLALYFRERCMPSIHTESGPAQSARHSTAVSDSFNTSSAAADRPQAVMPQQNAMHAASAQINASRQLVASAVVSNEPTPTQSTLSSSGILGSSGALSSSGIFNLSGMSRVRSAQPTPDTSSLRGTPRVGALPFAVSFPRR